MQWEKYFSCFLLTCVFFINCDTESNTEEKDIISLGGRKVLVSVYEGYDNNEESEPVFVMKMMTGKPDFDPPWFILETDLLVRDNSIMVKLIGVTDDINATHGSFPGPAVNDELFNLQSGEYTMKFYSEVDSFYHDIIVTDEMINVPYVNSSIIETDTVMTKLWRYPQNSCAVKVTINETKKWVAEAFRDSLVSKLNFQKHEFARKAVLPLNYGNTPYHYIYQNDDAFEDMVAYLETFTVETIIPNTDNSRDVQIEIVNWKNRRIKSGDFYQ